MTNRIDCYITAGGKATRMGGAIKAFVLIDGEKIIDRNIRTIKPAFQNISIISNSPSSFDEYQKQGFIIIQDVYKNIGPLAGLHTALANTKADAVFLMASDMPYVDIKLINEMIDVFQKNDSEVLIPQYNDRLEPLFAIYSKNILNKLELFINNVESRAMHKFIGSLNITKFELNEGSIKSLYNLNNFSDIPK